MTYQAYSGTQSPIPKFTSRYQMKKVYIEGVLYCIDDENIRLIDFYEPDRGFDFFTCKEELYEFIEWAADMDIEDLINHVYQPVFRPLKPIPPPIPIEEKLKHEIFRYEHWAILRIPNNEDFIQREGISMKHCLSVAYTDYCRRMEKGEIELYSLTDLNDGEPTVTIELANTKSSYGGPDDKHIKKPTVTQLRGHCNQCPPKDEYLKPIYEFFKTQDWAVAGHGVKSFDKKTDGDEFIRRYKEIYCPTPASYFSAPQLTNWAKRLKRRLWAFGGK